MSASDARRVPYPAIAELAEALEDADQHLATECNCGEPNRTCRVCKTRHAIREVQDQRRAWQAQARDLIHRLDDTAAETCQLLVNGCRHAADGLESEAALAQARSNLAREQDRH